MKIGRFANIDVFLHWSFALGLLYFVYDWKVRQGFEWTTVAALIGVFVFVFFCILLHEYGHALTARHFGVQTKDIILTPIGGVARLMGMPKRPFEELMITIAGPAVNLVIAAIAALVILATGGNWVWAAGEVSIWSIAPIAMWLNIGLFLFNLIPAFPMDGGRILRSCLSFFIAHNKATMVAGIVGQICAAFFVIYGLQNGDVGLALVGGFIFLAARSVMKMV